jgi:two-component system sensor histidine kinase DesK
VTNIVRHAQAHTCTLRFRNDRDGIRRLIVEDDGSHSSVTEGNGLRGMRERVEGLGGTLRLDRTRGTRLEVGLPPTPEAATA